MSTLSTREGIFVDLEGNVTLSFKLPDHNSGYVEGRPVDFEYEINRTERLAYQDSDINLEELYACMRVTLQERDVTNMKELIVRVSLKMPQFSKIWKE
ncbi:MAG: hypothetical protein AAFO91_04170 [Bacteroidota bacterium]